MRCAQCPLDARRKSLRSTERMICMKKTIALMYFTLCFLLFMTPTASAYIDPSVMTYAIQAIAGVAIAIGAVVGIYWRKAKKKVQNKLGIDENAKKEVEEEVVEFSDDNK